MSPVMMNFNPSQQLWKKIQNATRWAIIMSILCASKHTDANVASKGRANWVRINGPSLIACFVLSDTGWWWCRQRKEVQWSSWKSEAFIGTGGCRNYTWLSVRTVGSVRLGVALRQFSLVFSVLYARRHPITRLRWTAQSLRTGGVRSSRFEMILPTYTLHTP